LNEGSDMILFLVWKPSPFDTKTIFCIEPPTKNLRFVWKPPPFDTKTIFVYRTSPLRYKKAVFLYQNSPFWYKKILYRNPLSIQNTIGFRMRLNMRIHDSPIHKGGDSIHRDSAFA
jgi:hypothetical protein